MPAVALAALINDRLKGLPGAVGMNHKESRRGVGHPSQLPQGPGLLPASRINMIEEGTSHRGTDGLSTGPIAAETRLTTF